MFHGRVLHNVPDLKIGVRLEIISTLCSQTAEDVLEQTEIILQGARKIIMQAYIK